MAKLIGPADTGINIKKFQTNPNCQQVGNGWRQVGYKSPKKGGEAHVIDVEAIMTDSEGEEHHYDDDGKWDHDGFFALADLDRNDHLPVRPVSPGGASGGHRRSTTPAPRPAQVMNLPPTSWTCLNCLPQHQAVSPVMNQCLQCLPSLHHQMCALSVGVCGLQGDAGRGTGRPAAVVADNMFAALDDLMSQVRIVTHRRAVQLPL